MAPICTLETAVRTIDWQAIQLAFETSNASVRAIARLHAISHTAISKRARDRGWKRSNRSPPGGVESAVRREKALAATDHNLMLDILADVAGGVSVNMALKRVGVSPGTFYRTLASSTRWMEKYQCARASCMDAVADSLIELADEKPPLVMSGETGDPRVDPGWVSWQKNRIYARQWVLGRLAPRKYGDRIATEVSGPDAGPIETIGVVMPAGLQEAHDAAMQRLQAIVDQFAEKQDETQQPTPETSPGE